ncbi:D-alanyl-D-alanine carboxypeptidase family protein [Kocuria flava]|uniref:D-alanyl-D-alanine carboxypeptidase family protein n=1 Tax=Kocuria flava TaxID=446860 RepID=UPI001FF3D3E7|nr:D-alanyl-D-alanine carboxypeptidase family protein [Kocuria flava]MCJ8505756.1 D-alanyl-D-alanine carboxypeptidase family protein [Kocuria flava]
MERELHAGGRVRRTLWALLCAAGLVLGPVVVPGGPAPASAATAIEAEHARLGGAGGRLGAALGPEHCGLPREGCWRRFERGHVHWSPATGARATWGAVRAAWAAQGWERGPLGYPVSREVCGLRDAGCWQAFEGGVVLWSRASGAHPTGGAIRAAWLRHGAERGALGYPVSGESCSGSACRQSFQRGRVEWARGGGTRVHREIDRAASVHVVVNKRRPLVPADHAPADLESVEGQQLRSAAAAALRRMQRAAAADGAPFTVVSGYRSHAVQASLYQRYVALYGQAQADLISARPGHSEHQTGLAVDIGDPGGTCGLQTCFERTAAGAWARAHAHEHGFVVRYPAGHTATTGYAYEPWHLRWVGEHVARGMVEQGIPTLEHYMGLPPAPSY